MAPALFGYQGFENWQTKDSNPYYTNIIAGYVLRKCDEVNKGSNNKRSRTVIVLIPNEMYTTKIRK